MTRAPFPWAEVIGAGLGVLRLSPAAFWTMTPRELGHALRTMAGPATLPPERGVFDELMTRFPDGR